MKLAACLWLCLAIPAFAQLEVLPDDPAPAVFAGKPQVVHVALHNKADKEIGVEATSRIFQITSGTTMPIADAQPWKSLRVLPGQTILESATLVFPAVRVPSRFLVQWGELGRTLVSVYPDDLLKSLSQLTGEQPLGVFDPDHKLKPALKLAGVKVADFEIETADCRLALVWAKNLPDSIVSRVKQGMGVVWIHPTKAPAAYADRLEAGIVVVAPPSTVTGLADRPLPQLNLLRYAELAVQWPEPDQP